MYSPFLSFLFPSLLSQFSKLLRRIELKLSSIFNSIIPYTIYRGSRNRNKHLHSNNIFNIYRAFYGMDVSPASLLNGTFPRPKAADPLYSALSEVLTCTSDGTYVRTVIYLFPSSETCMCVYVSICFLRF
jgi:hypothetical protein